MLAVPCRRGADFAEIAAGVGFGQVHGAGPPARYELGEIGLALIQGAVGDQQVDGRLGQQRPHGEAHVGRLPHLLDGDGDQPRQPLATHGRRRGEADPAAFGEHPEGLGEAVRGAHGAVDQAAALDVARAVERPQHIAGQLARLEENGVDHIGGGVLAAGQGGNLTEARQFGEGETDVFEGR